MVACFFPKTAPVASCSVNILSLKSPTQESSNSLYCFFGKTYSPSLIKIADSKPCF